MFACFLAFSVNLSIFLVIGQTSPVTYQVLGHSKLIVILTSGIFILGEDSNAARLFGMLLALGGIVSYTELAGKIKKEAAAAAAETAAAAGAVSSKRDGLGYPSAVVGGGGDEEREQLISNSVELSEV
jgi:hypothetical protein